MCIVRVSTQKDKRETKKNVFRLKDVHTYMYDTHTSTFLVLFRRHILFVSVSLAFSLSLFSRFSPLPP